MSTDLIEKPATSLQQIEAQVPGWRSVGTKGNPHLLDLVVGDIYWSSINPNTQVSLAAGLTLLATLTQRVYVTDTNSGLNQYTVLIADSTMGKEGAKTGLNRILGGMRKKYQEATRFRGQEFRSPSAMLQMFAEYSGSFYYLKPEIGYWLQRMNVDKNAESALKPYLLDAYMTSGHGQTMQGFRYADKSANVVSVNRPCLTLLGDSVPEEWWPGMTDRNLRNGLASRFNIIKCIDEGDRYDKNAPKLATNWGMIDCLNQLAKNSVDWGDKDPYRIPEDASAEKFHEQYQKEMKAKAKAHSGSLVSHLYGRAHLKVLRIGAILAACRNMTEPVVTAADYEWGRDIVVEPSIRYVTSEIEQGNHGEQSMGSQQATLVRQKLLGFLGAYNPKWERYGMTWQAHQWRIITYSLLQHDCYNSECFKNDKMKKQALDSELKGLCDAGIVTETLAPSLSNSGAKGRVFYIDNPDALR